MVLAKMKFMNWRLGLKMNNYYSGHLAEYVALNYMRIKGWRKVATNYITGRGTGAGEIDLIVQKRRTLVFIEVKKRVSIENAAYAITPKQQERIRRAAESFLALHQQYADFDIRFDAILVKLPLRIVHIENAF